MTHDLREILRVAAGRNPTPSAVICDGRTLQSTPESGARAEYDGHKKNGSKVHLAVDTLGHLLALRVTTGKEQERDQVAALAAAVQEATGQTIRLAVVDQGYTGDQPAADAGAHEITLAVVRPDEAKKGFVQLPRRWVSEWSFGWVGRFRRLARDYERLSATLAGWYWVALVVRMLHRGGSNCRPRSMTGSRHRHRRPRGTPRPRGGRDGRRADPPSGGAGHWTGTSDAILPLPAGPALWGNVC
ncbi:MAG: Transposase domain protein [Gemmataceae bacterium]|nr:Transposase domain protein [Gemmataceae bacterium]